MKTTKLITALLFIILLSSCFENTNQEYSEVTAGKEQGYTERNQSRLLDVQPPPEVSWSMEREALTMRFEMMNNRSILFYMYIFNYAIQEPIGYYVVNKVSSVNSQLTATEQIVQIDKDGYDHSGADDMHSLVLSSPAEDGSYGTNGDGVFSFTPDMIYLEHNMQYIVSSVPLTFRSNPQKLVQLDVASLDEYKRLLDRLDVVQKRQ